MARSDEKRLKSERKFMNQSERRVGRRKLNRIVARSYGIFGVLIRLSQPLRSAHCTDLQKPAESDLSRFRLKRLSGADMRMNRTFPMLLLVPAVLSAAGTVTTLTSSANPAEFGHAVTLTATVAPSTATGKVTFYDGTTVLETETLASGKAVFTTTLLASGARSLKAYYEGDSKHTPSTSAIFKEQVNTISGNGFQTPAFYPAGADPYSIAVGDFNNDGKADLAVADAASPGYVTILLGNGDGTFQTATNYPAGAYGLTSIALADFNEDGKMDLAVIPLGVEFGPIAILLGNGDGTFQAPIIDSGFQSAGGVVVGDFNGDGKPDLASADFESVLVALGNGDGTFQAASTIYGGDTYFSAVAAGDFNGDGKADLALGTDSLPATVLVLLGNGNGTFQVGASSNLPEFPDQITVADFNGDGKADLALAEPALGTIPQFEGISILLGNGDGTFQIAVNYPVDTSTYEPTQVPVVVSDFNGDGIPDMAYVVYNEYGGNGSASVYLGNGDGSFQSPIYYALNSGYSPATSLTVGDFNGDGRADIAAVETNNTTGAVDVIINSVVGAPTTAALTSSANPSTYGQTLMLTATITPPTATGIIAFHDGTNLLGTGTLNGGTATLSISTLSGGQHLLTAIYGGDTYDAPSTSPVLIQTVNPAPTSVTISSSPDPSTYRQMVTLTAEVTSSATATGTVTFYRGSTSLGTATLSGNVATLSLASLPVGGKPAHGGLQRRHQ